MNEETLSYSLRNCDFSKGVVVREVDDLKAVLVKRRIRECCHNAKKGEYVCSKVRECLILLHANKKVGIIVHFPRSDIQVFMFKKYRNKHYMSKLVGDGFLKKLWPDIIDCEITNFGEFEKIQHLLTIAGFSVKAKSISQFKNSR